MRKKKSTQQLVGIESVTDSSVLTAGGELTFYLVQPTNLNVLPESGVRTRVQEDNDTNIQQETKDKEKNLYDPADDIKPIAVGTVTISISCVTLLNHLDVYEGDANAIPKGGEILPAVSVELYENDTAYTLLKRVCREKNIEVDGEWDADSAYITQIGSVSEFTAGPLSAWLFTVNGTIPDVDSQSHPLEDGDVVEWHYTCDFGNDIAEGMEN